MKIKNLFGMFAMASMLLATSCSQDEAINNAVADSNFVNATFSISTPEGIGTRGAVNVGEGTTVNYVACAVYDATGEEMDDLRQYVAINNKKAEYSIRLVKGQPYRVAFFAYYGEANGASDYYDMTELTEIQIKNAASNIEHRDAFTNYVDVTAEESMKAVEKPVTLYRPFAQLNLGAVAEDIEAAKMAGVVVTNSKITVSNVYTVFDAYNNTVADGAQSKEVTFIMNEIPTQDLAVDTDNNEDTPDETFEYLALNYLLVGNAGSEKELTDVTFEWLTADNKTNSPVTVFKNIPVQRNYRTNIIGYLLTNPAVFNITINENFVKPDYNVIYAGGTSAYPEKIENIMADINKVKDAVIKVPTGAYVSWTTGAGIGSTPFIGADNGVTETITIQGEGENSVLVVDGKGVGALRAANGAKVIFKDITIEDKSVSYAENSWEYGYLEFAGNLEFNNVVFKSAIMLEKVDGEADLNAIFTNCTFITNVDSEYGVWVADGTSVFNNCKFQGTRGLKMHEDYGSEIASVTVDACEFGPLSKKPGIAIGDLNAETAVTIKNSSFIGCQAGDQGNYMYETDTDVSTFTFVATNNSVEADPASIVKIGTKAELIAFQNEVNVNGNGFSGKTIKLTANIDLEGMTWEPVGQTGGNGVATYFRGVFDGQGYTISNFVITPNATYGKGANYASGIFGFVDAGDAVIKNLNVDGATVTGHHWTAVVCGYLSGSIQNCHVTNSTVNCTHANDDACGDKAGMIVGYTNQGSVKDCTAKDGTVTAGRDAGQIVGCNSASVAVTGCSATNVTVSATGDCTGANIKNDIIGRQN